MVIKGNEEAEQTSGEEEPQEILVYFDGGYDVHERSWYRHMCIL